MESQGEYFPFFFRPGKNEDSIAAFEALFKYPLLLKVAVAYFSHQRFADLIIERAQRKWQTQLLLNTSDILRPQEDSPDSSVITVSSALMRVLREETQYIETKTLGYKRQWDISNMHHKFMFNAETVVFGSVNMTKAAMSRNYEHFIVCRAPEVVHKFSLEFDALWQEAKDIYTGRDGALRSFMCPKCNQQEGIDFESWGASCLYCGHKFISA